MQQTTLDVLNKKSRLMAIMFVINTRGMGNEH
jgi:hypothetical protein